MSLYKTIYCRSLKFNSNYCITIYNESYIHKNGLIYSFSLGFSSCESHLSGQRCTVAGSLQEDMNLHGTLKQMEFSMTCSSDVATFLTFLTYRHRQKWSSWWKNLWFRIGHVVTCADCSQFVLEYRRKRSLAVPFLRIISQKIAHGNNERDNLNNSIFLNCKTCIW